MSLLPSMRAFFMPSEAAANASFPKGLLLGTMKITSSVIRLSTVARSPALLAASQVSTSSRMARSSSVILNTSSTSGAGVVLQGQLILDLDDFDPLLWCVEPHGNRKRG